MPFRIERNDIVRMRTDAVVNTANPEPLCGSGTDLAIYTAAGMDELLAARKEIGPIAAGDAAVTPGFALPAKYIIHAVGPVWNGGSDGETETLRRCVTRSLDLAKSMGCESIAFPLLSTGNNGFPKELALRTTLSAFSEWLMQDDNEMFITLTVFDRESADLSGQFSARLLGPRNGSLEEYIDDHYVGERMDAEYPTHRRRGRGSLARRASAPNTDAARGNAAPHMDSAWSSAEKSGTAAPASAEPEMPDAAPHHQDFGMPAAAPHHLDFGMPAAAPRPTLAGKPETAPRPAASGKKKPSLADRIRNIGDSFHTRLFRLIDERGMTYVQVYKAANLDKRLFSKILSNPKYKPKKETALALAIALRLNIDETADLLSRAGFALSPSNMTDVIVRYYIENGNYDMYDINYELFSHGEEPLGSWGDAGASAG